METEFSVPRSQEPATGPYIQLNPVNVFPSHNLKSYFNIILLSTLGYSKLCLSLTHSRQILYIYISPSPHSCCTANQITPLDLIIRIIFGILYHQRPHYALFSNLLLFPTS